MEKIGGFEQLLALVNSNNQPFWTATSITAGLGFFQYFYCVYITHRDGLGPFPLWMHLFFFAHDTVWSYLLYQAGPAYGHHPLFASSAKALVVWSLVELYCIYRAVAIEREGIFGPQQDPKALQQAYLQAFLHLLTYYALVFGLVHLIGRESFLQSALFTNIALAVGPGALWHERATRRGTSLVMATLLFLGTLNTFAPWSLWLVTLPGVFDTPSFHFTGLVCSAAAGFNLYIAVSKPPRETTSKTCEEKSTMTKKVAL